MSLPLARAVLFSIFKAALNVFTILIFLWLAGFAVYIYTSLTMQPEKPEQTTDVIVVLTGDENRIEAGLALLAAGKAKHLFISGVHKDVTEGDIRLMWTGTPPLPDCCLVLGRNAQTTEENGRETGAWLRSMNFTSIRLVTSGYHMHRAVMEISHAAPGVTILREPVRDVRMKNNMERLERLSQLLLSEYSKTLYRAFYILAGVLPARTGSGS